MSGRGGNRGRTVAALLAALVVLATSVTVVRAQVTGPTANDDSYETTQLSGVFLDPLVNDVAGDDPIDLASFTVITPPTRGTVDTFTAAGGTYTVTDLAFFGTDTIVYEICDTMARCDQGTISIEIVRQGPRPVDDDHVILWTATIDLDVLGNDLAGDMAIDPGSFSFTSSPANGTLSSADPTATYDPDPGFLGDDSFTYEICDVTALCTSATVTVSVRHVFRPPVAINDVHNARQGLAIRVPVTANDTSVNGMALDNEVTIVFAPGAGTATAEADGEIEYTPDGAFNGIDAVLYRICDESGMCDFGTLTINVGGALTSPIANDDQAYAVHGQTTTIPAMQNDFFVPASESFTITSGPSQGTTEITGSPASNQLTEPLLVEYTPNGSFVGDDSFTYELCDSNGCNSADVTVSVVAAPVAPTPADDDVYEIDTGDAETIVVLSNDSPGMGELDPTSVRITSLPANGRATVLGSGAIDYLPYPSFGSDDTFEYEVCNSTTGCATASVFVTSGADPNPPPTPTPTPVPTPTPTPTPVPDDTPVLCDGREATIVGTSGDDVLEGTDGDDVIVGLEGDDFIRGRGGDDLVCAGPGRDRVIGGGGADEIYGQRGADTINGNSGADSIWGGSGGDTIRGNKGADRIRGGTGADNIHGGSGGDVINGNGGTDEISGAKGNDEISGGSKADDISGGSGNDEISGGKGPDTLDGGSGFDRCDGGTGSDTSTRCETRISASLIR